MYLKSNLAGLMTFRVDKLLVNNQPTIHYLTKSVNIFITVRLKNIFYFVASLNYKQATEYFI